MTGMDTVDSEIDEIERGIKTVEGYIAWAEQQLESYKQMPEGEFRDTYMGQLYVSLGRYGDEIEKLKHRRYELWNYRFHQGQWWKCPYCDTSNPPSRNTCQNCI